MGGQEYRVRSDADPEWLARVAALVDESMERIRTRTDTVDSLAIATLAALNIARELVELRESLEEDPEAPEPPDPQRLQALIEQTEAAL